MTGQNVWSKEFSLFLSNQSVCFSCKLTRIKQTYTCSWTCCPTNTLYRLIWSNRDACIYVNICIHVCLSEIVLTLSGSKRTKQRWPRKTVENDRVKQLWYPWRRITEHLCHSTNANRVLNRALAPCWKYMHRHTEVEANSRYNHAHRSKPETGRNATWQNSV